MKVLNLSLKQFVFILVLTLFSAFTLAYGYTVKPYDFIAYPAAFLLVGTAGLISDVRWGAASGLLGTSAGLALLHFVLQENNEKLLEARETYLAFTRSNAFFLILGGVVIGFLGGLLARYLNRKAETSPAPAVSQADRKQPFLTTRELTLMAMFVAIGVAINTVRVGMFSFGGFPIILSGYVLGPVPGLIIGGVTDLVAFIVRPSAFPFNPAYTLTSALTGFIPVFLTRLLGDRYPKYSYLKVLIGTFVGQFLTSVFLVSVFRTVFQASQSSFWVQVGIYAGQSAIKQAWSVPLYAFLIVSVIEALHKAIKTQVRPKRKLSPDKGI